MASIFVRTFIIYIIIAFALRLMGKRQIGELEVTDLVTTLLLSEIASLPITNHDLPVTHALIPMITLLFLEVTSSVVLIKFPKLKPLVSARPTVIIQNGTLDQRAIRALRISLDELMSEIRQQGLTSLSQVECAILEKNGKLTVLPKPAYVPPSAEQLGVKVNDEPLMHIVYMGGTFSDTGLRLIGKDRAWLEKVLKKRGLQKSRLYCVTANESGDVYWIERTKEGRS